METYMIDFYLFIYFWVAKGATPWQNVPPRIADSRGPESDPNRHYWKQRTHKKRKLETRVIKPLHKQQYSLQGCKHRLKQTGHIDLGRPLSDCAASLVIWAQLFKVSLA